MVFKILNTIITRREKLKQRRPIETTKNFISIYLQTGKNCMKLQEKEIVRILPRHKDAKEFK